MLPMYNLLSLKQRQLILSYSSLYFIFNLTLNIVIIIWDLYDYLYTFFYVRITEVLSTSEMASKSSLNSGIPNLILSLNDPLLNYFLFYCLYRSNLFRIIFTLPFDFTLNFSAAVFNSLFFQFYVNLNILHFLEFFPL